MKKALFAFIFILVALGVAAVVVYSWLNNQAFSSTMSSSNVPVEFEIKEGQGSEEIGQSLENQKLIKDKNLFYYYVWKTETSNLLQAGIYELSPNMTIGEMVDKFKKGDVLVKTLKLTIPEGFTNKKIVEALEGKKPSITQEFTEIVNCKCLGKVNCGCDVFSKKYDILKEIPSGVDMEGYLFPDTYFIDEEETGATLVSKFLNNFNKKVDEEMKAEIRAQGKSLHEVITLASIVEREVRTDRDRKLVAGIFRKRIDDEFPLQSCATLSYFLGIDKPQFSYEDTQQESPYNTYINPGLPPGPISNPGLDSIEAVVYPEASDYYYFLSNPETGETFYSTTLEEHNQKKLENGL